MAIKHFIASCRSKKTKHPDGEIIINIPVVANTMAEGKQIVWGELAAADEHGNSEYFQVPALKKITEEEYNKLTIVDESSDLEAENEKVVEDDKEWPTVNSSGFYPKETEGLLRTSFTLNDNIAEIAALEAKKDVFVYGYRYMSGPQSIVKPTSHDNGEYPNIEEALQTAVETINNIAEFQAEHGAESDQAFANEVMSYDFETEILSQLEVDDESEDQLSIDDQIGSTLEGQIDIDVCLLQITDSLSAQLAVIEKKPNEWFFSYQLENTEDRTKDKGNVRDFSIDAKSTRKNAITHAMGMVGNWLYELKEMQEGMKFFKRNAVETFDTNISHQIVINLDKAGSLISEEMQRKVNSIAKVFKEAPPYTPATIWEERAYGILTGLDKADYSKEQYEEMGEKLMAVFGELDKNIDVEYAIKAFVDTEWDDANTAVKTMLNLRMLRAFVRDECIKKPVKKHDSLCITSVGDKDKPASNDDTKQETPPKTDPLGNQVKNVNYKPDDEQPKVKAEKPESLPPAKEKQVAQEKSQNTNEQPQDLKQDPPAENESRNAETEKPTVIELSPELIENPNMGLWAKGFKTDLNFTKLDNNNRLSIKTQYRIQKATEIWGPVGIGWGYKVIREWTVQGAPIIMNGSISELFTQVHKCEIEFWYMHEGAKATLTSYGDTKKLYMAQGGYFVHDDECEKKSLSDALGKAMSLTGICADVYLGSYDDTTIQHRAEVAQAADKQVRTIEQTQEITQKALTQAGGFVEEMKTALNLSEINILKQKSLAILSALPTGTDEQKQKKSKAIKNVDIAFSNASENLQAAKKESVA